MEVTNVDFGGRLHAFLLRYGVGDNNSLEHGVVDSGNGRTRQNPVRTDGIHLQCAGLQQSDTSKFMCNCSYTKLQKVLFTRQLKPSDNNR